MSSPSVLAAIVAVALLGLFPDVASSQDRPPPLVPAAPGDAGPTWQRTLRLGDGRTFVTDGALAMDAALAKPAPLPADALPPASASFVERHLAARSPDEFGLSELSPRPDAKTYRTPNGVDLSQAYIDFLRRTLPPAQVRLRMGGGREPVVILLDGKPVGVLMPVAR